GTASARNVVLSDPLPEQMTFVSATAGGQVGGNQVKWQLGTLGPGATRKGGVVLKPKGAGRVRNPAIVTADRGLTDEADVETHFVGVSALETELRDTDDPVEVGAESSYVITARNTGMVPATNVRIDAVVPPEMEIRRVQGPADHRKYGQRITF